MKTPSLVLVLALFLALLATQPAGAFTNTEEEFFLRLKPGQAALLIEGEFVGIVDLVRMDDKHIEFKINGSVGKPVRDWIEASLNMNYMRKSGELVTADFNRMEKSVREFHDVLLEEVALPQGDGVSQNVPFARIKFAPGTFRIKQRDDRQLNLYPTADWAPPKFKVIPCVEGNCD